MSEYEIQVGSLEELALKRRERLKNLKRKAQGVSNETTTAQPAANDESSKINLPRPTELLKTQDAADDKNDDTEMEVEEFQSNDVVTTMTAEMEAMKHPLVIDEIDIQNLAPRKPDWDLKRDVSKKLEILERRTQRAIAELIRERLKSNQTDLSAVNAIGYSAQS